MSYMKNWSTLTLIELLDKDGIRCHCGKLHKADVKEVLIEHNALVRIPDILEKYGAHRPFIVADKNTYFAAGKRVCDLLNDKGVEYSSFVFPQDNVEPDEFSVGQVVMNFDFSCDFIIGVGSGTINDISKLVAKLAGLKYMIVGTAPSMDGFASSTSSMIRNKVKVSLPSACPVAIVADIDIICNAPKKLLQAGFGDLLAKYISICEWRISHLITGEYYCEEVANLVRRSLKKSVESVDGLLKREPDVIVNIMEGLILAGIAMSYAGLSRPASGIEHYFSHIWDMRALNGKNKAELHGIQVAIGTVLSLQIYDMIKQIVPDRNRALSYVDGFEIKKWEEFLLNFLGDNGKVLIELEKKEGKYDRQKHRARLDIIIDSWQEILRIISEELPETSYIVELLKLIDAPVKAGDIGLSRWEVRDTFIITKDIRDKYIASRLLWDLGMLEEVADSLIAD